jgi:F-type H+-transporting ATPase subunit epsilon
LLARPLLLLAEGTHFHKQLAGPAYLARLRVWRPHVTDWRVAGMSYLKYSNLCADMVRAALKEPAKSKAKAREVIYFRQSIWKDGVPQKQGEWNTFACRACWGLRKRSRVCVAEHIVLVQTKQRAGWRCWVQRDS